MADRVYDERKTQYFAKLASFVKSCPQILVVECDNVGSRQMAEIRVALRGKADVLMGKNTMIRTCLRRLAKEQPAMAGNVQKLLALVKMNIGFVFCKVDPVEVRKVILDNRVPAPARQGAVAPCDVTIPAGGTGMDPGQTSFFQALSIPTKIQKGQIEIVTDVPLLKTGDKVTASQAVLLQKLNIRPFSYGLVVSSVFDNGSVYSASVLDITDEILEKKFKTGIQNLTALSLAIGVPTEPAVPHMIANAFKNAVGLALAIDYSFPQIAAIKAAIENPGAYAAAAAPAAGAAAAAAAPVEEEEEEDADMGFSLFD